VLRPDRRRRQASATRDPEHIYLAVDAIDGAFARCKVAHADFPRGRTGGAPLAEIAQRPWGERSFYVHDPFGNPVRFVERPTMFTG
jgi:hypothetical protein